MDMWKNDSKNNNTNGGNWIRDDEWFECECECEYGWVESYDDDDGGGCSK